MKEIVKVLLQEGINEEVIHEVLNIIEAEYDLTRRDIPYHKSVERHYKKEVKKLRGPALKAEREAKKASDEYWKANKQTTDLTKEIGKLPKFGEPKDIREKRKESYKNTTDKFNKSMEASKKNRELGQEVQDAGRKAITAKEAKTLHIANKNGKLYMPGVRTLMM